MCFDLEVRNWKIVIYTMLCAKNEQIEAKINK